MTRLILGLNVSHWRRLASPNDGCRSNVSHWRRLASLACFAYRLREPGIAASACSTLVDCVRAIYVREIRIRTSELVMPVSDLLLCCCVFLRM